MMSISHPVSVWMVVDERLEGPSTMGLFSTETLAEAYVTRQGHHLESPRVIEYLVDELVL